MSGETVRVPDPNQLQVFPYEIAGQFFALEIDRGKIRCVTETVYNLGRQWRADRGILYSPSPLGDETHYKDPRTKYLCRETVDWNTGTHYDGDVDKIIAVEWFDPSTGEVIEKIEGIDVTSIHLLSPESRNILRGQLKAVMENV